MNGLKRLAAVAILSSLCLTGCGDSKSLTRGYRLERFSEGNTVYYVHAPSGNSDDGAFKGSVSEIGWNSQWILARVTRSYRGDTDGWYVLNLKTKLVTGPFDDAALKTNSAFSDIKPVTASSLFHD